jgi:hypothetical protein
LIGAATTCLASASGTTYNSDVTIGDLGKLYIYDIIRGGRQCCFAALLHEPKKSGGARKETSAKKAKAPSVEEKSAKSRLSLPWARNTGNPVPEPQREKEGS